MALVKKSKVGGSAAGIDRLEAKAADACEKMRAAARTLSRSEPRRNETPSEYRDRWQKAKERADAAESVYQAAERILWAAQDAANVPRTRGG